MTGLHPSTRQRNIRALIFWGGFLGFLYSIVGGGILLAFIFAANKPPEIFQISAGAIFWLGLLILSIHLTLFWQFKRFLSETSPSA